MPETVNLDDLVDMTVGQILVLVADPPGLERKLELDTETDIEIARIIVNEKMENVLAARDLQVKLIGDNAFGKRLDTETPYHADNYKEFLDIITRGNFLRPNIRKLIQRFEEKTGKPLLQHIDAYQRCDNKGWQEDRAKRELDVDVYRLEVSPNRPFIYQARTKTARRTSDGIGREIEELLSDGKDLMGVGFDDFAGGLITFQYSLDEHEYGHPNPGKTYRAPMERALAFLGRTKQLYQSKRKDNYIEEGENINNIALALRLRNTTNWTPPNPTTQIRDESVSWKLIDVFNYYSNEFGPESHARYEHKQKSETTGIARESAARVFYFLDGLPVFAKAA